VDAYSKCTMQDAGWEAEHMCVGYLVWSVSYARHCCIGVLSGFGLQKAEAMGRGKGMEDMEGCSFAVIFRDFRLCIPSKLLLNIEMICLYTLSRVGTA
jgi:hypothetical protein